MNTLNSIRYCLSRYVTKTWEADEQGYIYQLALNSSFETSTYIRTFTAADAAAIFILDRNYWGPANIFVHNVSTHRGHAMHSADTMADVVMFQPEDIRSTLGQATLYVNFYTIKGHRSFQVWECVNNELINMTWRASVFMTDIADTSRIYTLRTSKGCDYISAEDDTYDFTDADLLRAIEKAFTRGANDRRFYSATRLPGTK